MKIFQLTLDCGGYENDYQFSHEDDSKTEKQFQKDVKFLFRKYSLESIKKEEYQSMDRITTFVVDKMNEFGYEKYTQKINGKFYIPGILMFEPEFDNNNLKSVINLIGKKSYKIGVERRQVWMDK